MALAWFLLWPILLAGALLQEGTWFTSKLVRNDQFKILKGNPTTVKSKIQCASACTTVLGCNGFTLDQSTCTFYNVLDITNVQSQTTTRIFVDMTTIPCKPLSILSELSINPGTECGLTCDAKMNYSASGVLLDQDCALVKNNSVWLGSGLDSYFVLDAGCLRAFERVTFKGFTQIINGYEWGIQEVKMKLSLTTTFPSSSWYSTLSDFFPGDACGDSTSTKFSEVKLIRYMRVSASQIFGEGPALGYIKLS